MTILSCSRIIFFKRILAAVFFAIGINLFPIVLFAQSKAEKDTSVEVPSPPSITGEFYPNYKHGGGKGMIEFIARNLKHPQDSVEGKVFVSFMVDTLGHVQKAKIERGLTEETDAEVLRVVNMLEFYPATQNGKRIALVYNIPVKYRINKNKKK